MKKNTTFVSFLLDETGSMQSIKGDTVGGFNAYVETLQKGGADIVFSLVSFNSNKTTPRYVADPIDTIKPLTEDTYQPAAATPLIDASVKIINATDDAVKKRGDDPNVLIVFQTDGEENVSVEYTNADLATLIKEKTAAGWQFLFLGAGLDAFAAARDAGITIDAGHHVSYQRHLSREAFAETAANTEAFAVSGLAKSLDYSRAQRARVGDTHTEKHLDPTAKPRQESTPTKRPTKTRGQRSSSVDDIDLNATTTEDWDVERVLAFIYKRWPVVRSQVPEHVAAVCRNFKQGGVGHGQGSGGFMYGVSSHPNVADNSWVQSKGFMEFALETAAPDDFFWMGVQDRGGSEYFFFMWYRNRRRFWFYDQYIVHVAQVSAVSSVETLKHLVSALDRWASTTGDVIYSGPWDGFDPSTEETR